MKPKIEKLLDIPIVVVHRLTPAAWKLRPNSKAPRSVGDPPGPPLCFVAYDVKRPLVELGHGIKLPSDPPPPVYQNGLTLRERFMNLSTEKHFLEFLNEFGRFSPLAEAEKKFGWQLRDLVGSQIMFSELAERSPETWSEFANSLMSPKSKVPMGIVSAFSWSSDHNIEFRWKGSPQPDWMGARNIGMITATNVLEAILTTIEIDHLRGVQLKGCARHDCKNFFEITSQHKRSFCTQYCAHLESLRRTRKRQKSDGAKRGKKVRVDR